MQFNRLSIPLLFVSLSAASSCAAGISVRPKVPTFEAQADLGPVATVDANSSAAYAEPAPVAGPAAYAEPTMGVQSPQSGFSRSGGATAETAQLIKVGDTITGSVTKGVPAYYAIDLQAAETLELKFLLRTLESDWEKMRVRLVDPQRVLVRSGSFTVQGETSEQTRSNLRGTTTLTGRHLLKVTTDGPVAYQMQLANPSTGF